MTTVTLHGAICGDAWMGYVATLELHPSRLGRETDITAELTALLRDKGGDFQTPYLTADSWLEVTRVRQSGRTEVRRTRQIDVTDLPSLAPLVRADVYASDAYDA